MARFLATIALLSTASFASAEIDSFRYYAIGASFMNDHHPHNADYFSPWFGMDIDAGYHIRGGSTTTDIINNPLDADTREEYGTYQNALVNHEWDALVVQVFAGNGAGMAEDIANLQYFASLMDNPETPIYIYETWPWRFQVDNWELPLSDGESQWRREYYHRIADELSPTIENPVHLIPTGEVITTLAKATTNGSLRGVETLSDVYRDALHASNLSGALLSAVTVGTMTGVGPVGAPPSDSFIEKLKPEQVGNWDALLAAAWQAAALEPRSPIEPLQLGDYNSDGLVGSGDRLAFASQYGGASVEGLNGDGNGDGVVNTLDYVVWREAASSTTDFLPPPTTSKEGLEAIDHDTLSSLLGAVGQPADGNGDGVVNAADYVMWRESGADDDGQLATSSDGEAQSDGPPPLDPRLLDQELLNSLYGAVDQPADGNGDGVVNAADYAIWRESQAALSLLDSIAIGDYNGDGVVEASDRRHVFELYGSEVPNGRYADGSGDGIVNSLDYVLWRENIGRSTGTAVAIPEPSGGTVALMALVPLLKLARGRNQWICAG